MIIMILLIIVLAGFFFALYYVNQKRLQHLISIAPDDLVHYQGINLVKDSANSLGQIGMDAKHPVHYIGVDQQHRVLFPESKFGNRRRYYLTATSFSPKLSKTGQPRDHVKAAVNVKQTAYGDQARQSSHTYLTLLKSDFSDAFKVEIKAQVHDIHALNRTYALSAAQLKSLRNRITKH